MDIKVRSFSGEAIAMKGATRMTNVSDLQARCATSLGLPGVALHLVHDARLLRDDEGIEMLQGATLDIVTVPHSENGLDLGSVCLVLQPLTLRKAAESKSEVITDLNKDENVKILEFGISQCGLHYAKVTTGLLTGWVPTQYLMQLSPESFKVGARCRTLSTAAVYREESAHNHSAELASGTRVTVLGQGVHDRHRVLIVSPNGCYGWIFARKPPRGAQPLICEEGLFSSVLSDVGDMAKSAPACFLALLQSICLWLIHQVWAAIAPHTRERWRASSNHISIRHHSRFYTLSI